VLVIATVTTGVYDRSGDVTCQRDVCALDPSTQACHAVVPASNHCEISAFIIYSLIIRDLLVTYQSYVITPSRLVGDTAYN
jgi:hypothetical protein